MGLVPAEFETDDFEKKKLSASSQNVTDFCNTSLFILGPYFLPHPPQQFSIFLSNVSPSVGQVSRLVGRSVRSVVRSVVGKVGRWFVHNVLYSPIGQEWCRSFSLCSFFHSRFNWCVFSDTCCGTHRQQKEIAWNLTSKDNRVTYFLHR